MELIHGDVTREVIGAAIEVHGELGPGLLEAAYDECLAVEMAGRGLRFERQMKVPVRYKGQLVKCGFRPDYIVEDCVLVELKSVEKLVKIHEAQLLTYLRLLEKKVGLLINFNVSKLMDGLIRRVL